MDALDEILKKKPSEPSVEGLQSFLQKEQASKPKLDISSVAGNMKQKKGDVSKLLSSGGVTIKPKEVTKKNIEGAQKIAESNPDDASTLAKAAETKAKADDGQKLTGSEKIYLALISTLPTVIGAAFGGSEGAAAGAKTSGDIAGAFGKVKMDEANSAREQQEKLEMAKAKSLEDALKRKEEQDLRRELQANQLKQSGDNAAMMAGLNAPLKELALEEKTRKLKEGSDQQKLAAGYARRTEQAEQVMKDLMAGGYKREAGASGLASVIPINALKPGNLKAQEQAEENFLSAVLRRESGASISPAEREFGRNQYFPRAGDTPEVLAQKEANRLQSIEALKASAGVALENVPLVNVKNLKSQSAPKEGQFPRTVSNGSAKAVVSNQQELDEAMAEGFR